MYMPVNMLHAAYNSTRDQTAPWWAMGGGIDEFNLEEGGFTNK